MICSKRFGLLTITSPVNLPHTSDHTSTIQTAENADKMSNQGSVGLVKEEGEGEEEAASPKGEVKPHEGHHGDASVTQPPPGDTTTPKDEVKGQGTAGHEASQAANDELFHSYSDSSDASSDEFFDADTVLDPPPPPTVLTSPSLSVPAVDGEDPDDVEEDDELQEQDDTSGGVAANKSVIMHMLSQVRVGVDLTKIVLPTFILEKRSLLEMYAEFFAHPDVFARSASCSCLNWRFVVTMAMSCDSIADYSDPRDRMVAIVRYYLSAFHSARKVSTVPPGWCRW